MYLHLEMTLINIFIRRQSQIDAGVKQTLEIARRKYHFVGIFLPGYTLGTLTPPLD